MTLIQGMLFGIGMLILVYLAVTNNQGVVTIFGQTSKSINQVATTLQGR